MRTIAILIVCTLGLFGSLGAQDIHVKISPNPASSSIELSLTGTTEGKVDVEIFTVLGTRIYQAQYNLETGQTTIQLSISTIPDGIYLVRVSQNGNASVRRLKIQHTE